MTAPFHPDCSQRILAIHFYEYGACYAISTELLLRLAREREGQDVRWYEWGSHAIEVYVGDPGDFSQVWVSGCRLFCVVSDGVSDEGDHPYYLRIYDFSHAGRTKYLSTWDELSKGGGTRRISPSLGGYKLPWNSADFCDAFLTTGHDSTVFWVVSASPSPLAHD